MIPVHECNLPCISFLQRKHFIKSLTHGKNVNNITIEQYSIVVTYLLPKKTSPFQTHIPIHHPSHKYIFALQKEVLSHACKPVLGLAFPKWAQKIWGIHFAMGNFHCEFSKQFKSFLKVSHPFCNGFVFHLYRPFCNGLL